MRIIPLMYVKEHQKLGSNLFDNKHRLLLRAGVFITKSNKQRLLDGGYLSVYIKDEYSDNQPELIVSDYMQSYSFDVVKNAFSDFKVLMNLKSKPNSSDKSFKINNLMKQRDKQMEAIVKMADDFIGELAENRNSRLENIQPKNIYNYNYQHAINTGILSALIGFRLKRNYNEIKSMFLASVLCEMGNLTIPESILLKKGRLTTEEYDIVKRHCYDSYQEIGSCMDLNYMIKLICLEHHEKVDGSGYPNGLIGDNINIMARIIAVADAYDALTSDRSYRIAYPPHKALEVLKDKSDIYYDKEVVEVLSEIIQPFPIGTIVTLNNKVHGVVIESNEIEALRPKVKLVGDDVKESIIDLISRPSIEITGIKYNL